MKFSIQSDELCINLVMKVSVKMSQSASIDNCPHCSAVNATVSIINKVEMADKKL